MRLDTWDNGAVRSELAMGRDEYEFEACDASLIGRERADSQSPLTAKDGAVMAQPTPATRSGRRLKKH
jgi:hypothetical protein